EIPVPRVIESERDVAGAVFQALNVVDEISVRFLHDLAFEVELETQAALEQATLDERRQKRILQAESLELEGDLEHEDGFEGVAAGHAVIERLLQAGLERRHHFLEGSGDLVAFLSDPQHLPLSFEAEHLLDSFPDVVLLAIPSHEDAGPFL